MSDLFDAWWEAEGVFLDPDTADVPWFDKRRELAFDAYAKGFLRAIENLKGQEIRLLPGAQYVVLSMSLYGRIGPLIESTRRQALAEAMELVCKIVLKQSCPDHPPSDEFQRGWSKSAEVLLVKINGLKSSLSEPATKEKGE